jgi:hypothetical protein
MNDTPDNRAVPPSPPEMRPRRVLDYAPPAAGASPATVHIGTGLGVLNYATPQSRRRLRKPVRTRIEPRIDADAAIFTEVPDDTPTALAAVFFSLLPLTTLGFVIVEMLSESAPSDRGALLTAAIVWGALLALMLAVVLRFFQRSGVRADASGLKLSRRTLFINWEKHWMPDAVTGIWIVPRGSVEDALADLRLHFRGEAPIVLFRNYGQLEMSWIASVLGERLGRPPEVGDG